MEMFKNVKSHGKWKYTVTKITFWPNIKYDILGNILTHMERASWVLKGLGISSFYHGKVME